MMEKARQATALILIVLLLATNFMIEVAHHHFVPSARQPDQNLKWQNPSPLPTTKSVQSLCLACLFARENQSIGSDVAFLSSLPSFPFVTPIAPSLFAQLKNAPCHNRAPPCVDWL